MDRGDAAAAARTFCGTADGRFGAQVWPNTFRAHQLLRFAPLEKEGAVKQRIMEGIYERGENVSDVATLCAVAADAGVDVDGFKEILDTPAARDDVRRECAQASARGVGGVPYRPRRPRLVKRNLAATSQLANSPWRWVAAAPRLAT